MKNKVIEVQNVQISISKQELDDYICITDIAKAKTGESRSADVVKNWLRNRNTLEFLGTWEMIYNPDFKVVEFDHFKSEAGLHTFVLSVAEWINQTNAIGLYVKRGKYGGTYAHKDIAFEIIGALCDWKYIGRTLTETGSHLTPHRIFTNLIKCAIVTLYLALCVKEC